MKHKTVRTRLPASLAILTAGAALTLLAADAAWAEDPPKDGVTLSGFINVDIVGAVQGGVNHRARELDKASLMADFRWNGFSGLINVMNTSGAMPNSDVGALQGVNNIEVGRRRLRLFEAYVQHDLFTDKLALKGGLIDVNTGEEFMVTDASGIFLAPEFGVMSELAASGPGGPSIYPAAGLSLQLDAKPMDNVYVRATVSNAHLGDLGDPGGVNTTFDLGVLSLVEGGYEKDDTKLSIGGWRYSRKQDDLFNTVAGIPVPRTAGGAYVMGQTVVFGDEKANKATAFFRAGLSDGDTGPLKGTWSAGVTIEALGGKAGRSLGIAIDQAMLGDKYRLANAPLGGTESHAELTFSQDLSHGVSIQPDLQYVIHPGGDKSAKNAVVLGLRLTKSFGGE